MGKGASAPKPPDPVKTAEAQAKANKETAIAQTGLNAQNQNTPTGSLSYKQIGTWPDGTPRFEATTTLTPDQQRLLDQQEQFGHLFGETALAQGQAVQDTLSKPFDLSNEATEARLMELGSKRLDPLFEQRRQSEEANLAARGVMPGTEAYDRAMANFNQGRNDAYNQLLLQGRGQAVQEALTQRNQPLNEIIAMMSGSQVQQPNFVNTPNTGIANTDVAGITQNAYNQQLAAWQANQANNPMGSILQGAGMLGGWMFSDPVLKDDLGVIGEAGGIPVHAYTPKGSSLMQIGMMADEVAAVKPHAVRRGPGGLMQVNYEEAIR